MRTYNLLEVGAAALLVGDLKAKMKGQPWKFFGTADMPYLDQLLQPSPVSAITDSSAARAHLRAITACKRTKSGPSQIWYAIPSCIISLASLVNFVQHFKIKGLSCNLDSLNLKQRYLIITTGLAFENAYFTS